MVKFLPFRGAQLEYANLHCDSECITDKRANTFRVVCICMLNYMIQEKEFFFFLF